MKKFSSSLLLVLILMFTITSQTTFTINNTTITVTTTTTFSPICAAAEPAVVSSQEGCINKLTEMAVCLPYIASSPNILTDEVPSSCCDRYTTSDRTGSVTCLCHLVNEPSLLGFPVNLTRIFALSTVCPLTIPVNQISIEVQCDAISPNMRLGTILGSAPSASASEESNESPPAITTTLPADEAHTNSSLPADEAHTNLTLPFPTHTSHINFGSKLLPRSKRKDVAAFVVGYLMFVVWHLLIDIFYKVSTVPEPGTHPMAYPKQGLDSSYTRRSASQLSMKQHLNWNVNLTAKGPLHQPKVNQMKTELYSWWWRCGCCRRLVVEVDDTFPDPFFREGVVLPTRPPTVMPFDVGLSFPLLVCTNPACGKCIGIDLGDWIAFREALHAHKVYRR